MSNTPEIPDWAWEAAFLEKAKDDVIHEDHCGAADGTREYWCDVYLTITEAEALAAMQPEITDTMRAAGKAAAIEILETCSNLGTALKSGALANAVIDAAFGARKEQT